MIGSDFTAPGGITAVIRTYAECGLFERWPVRFLATYRTNRFADKLAAAAGAFFVFLGMLLRGRVAAVHAHTAARGSFWRKSAFLLAARLAGAKSILHLHDGSFPAYYETRSPLIRKLIRYVLACVDRVVVLTPGWAARIAAIEPRARLCVIANPVVPLSIPRAPREGEILFLGRLWREKGIFDLIEAAAAVVKACPHARFVCAGDGDVDALKTFVAKRGLADVFCFPGWVDGAEKDRLLATADVFVLPSYFEGLPIGVLEAMVNGIPVVATEVGGIPEALGTDTGVVIPCGAPQALALALIALLSDADIKHRLGAAASARGRRDYAADVVLEQISALYDELGLSRPAACAASLR